MTDQELTQYYRDKASGAIDSDITSEEDPLSKFDNYYKQKAAESLGQSLTSGSDTSVNKMNMNDLAQRKQDRLSNKAVDLSNDDSNFMIKAKEAYNYVNDLWEKDSTAGDLKANYMGKQQSMSNKIFEDVNATMDESKAKQQELIDQYNNAEDDPNARHKVYQLRLKDGIDEYGNPIYTYKTGIAESSAADRYKNQIAAQGYEILSEKGFAGAEDWENKWHGLKSNIADRTFDEGYNAKGQKIKNISNFGEGYSEIYNTQNFNQGVSEDQIAANMAKSQALAQQAAERRKEGYGRGSDSIVDAFQAGAVKTGLDIVDTALDIVTPGENTLLDNVRKQSSIDKWVGYNRKTGDKAIGEATAYFNQGDYASALWEVVKNPQITAESLPANLEMAFGFGKFTRLGKLGVELAEAKKVGDAAKVAELSKEAANDITTSQKIMHNVAKNAGFYSQVAATTNNDLEERVKNNLAAGMEGGDSLHEAAAVFASNFLSLGLDRVAFGKITGIGAGKKSLADAYGFADADGKKTFLSGVLNQAYKMVENGSTEAAQEYVQTWDEILNQQLGTGKNGTLSEIFNSEKNQDEAIGAMLAGSAGGIHIGVGADAISTVAGKVYDLATGAEEQREASRLNKVDASELDNILRGVRSADNLPEGSEPESRVSASKATALSVARNGHKVVMNSLLNSLDGDIQPAEIATRLINAVGTEYSDDKGAGASAGSKVMMNRNITSFVGNLMTGMNELKFDEERSKPLYDKAVAEGKIDPEKTTVAQFMSDKIDKQKLEISQAIGTSLDGAGIDISGTVIDKFKFKYIIEPLNEAKKKTRLSDENADKVAGGFSDISNVGKPIPSVDPRLTQEDAKKILESAKILYALGGNKDTDLADLIDQIHSQKGNDSVTIMKTTMNVAQDVLKNGFEFGKASKKSIPQHSEGISNSIADSIESIDAKADDKVVGKKLESVNKEIDDILTFAVSRTQGQDSYVNDKNLEDFKNSDNMKEAIKNYVVNMIGSTPVGKFKSKEVDKDGNPIFKNENPIVVFEKNEKARLSASKVDTKLQERFGIKNNSRDIIAGATKNGMISSFIHENKLIVKELNKSIEMLNELKATLVQAGKETTDVDDRISTATALAEHLNIMNEVYKQIHLNSNFRLKNSKEKQYLKQVIEPGEMFIDPDGVKREATLKDIAIAMYNDKIFTDKMNQKSKEKGVESEASTSTTTTTEVEKVDTNVDTSENISEEINDEFGVNLDSNEDTLFEDADELLISGSEMFITSDSNAVKAAESIQKLYDSVINSKLINKFKKIIQKKLDAEYTGFRPTESKLFSGVISYLDGQFNDLNYSHEMFHAMSYKNLEKKLTKSDREFVSNMKDMFSNLDIDTFDKFKALQKEAGVDRISERLYDDIKQIKNSIDAENNIFEKELAAILYSNADARKFIVNTFDSASTTENKASRRKSISDFIKAVFKAYKEIADMLEKAFSGDKDNGINTKSDAYRSMVKFVGNSLKQEAARTNTYEDMKSDYDSILSRFTVDKNSIDIKEPESKNSLFGTLRSVSKNGKSVHVNYDVGGKSRNINSRGIETLIVKLNNNTLNKNEMEKLKQVINAYDRINVSPEEAVSNVDAFYDLKKNNQEKNENKKPEQSEGAGEANKTDKPSETPKEPEKVAIDSIVGKINSLEVNDDSVIKEALSSLDKNKDQVTPDMINDFNAIINVLEEINKCEG